MLDPRAKVFPSPLAHADLAALAALGVADEKRAAAGGVQPAAVNDDEQRCGDVASR